VPARVYAFYKPRGALVSTVSQGGAPVVFDLLPEPYRGWTSVGRLDKDSEGLLLLCDDSRLAQRLMDPGGVAKTYQVAVRGFPREDALEAMRRGGLEVDGRPLLPVEVTRLGKAPRGGTRFEVMLHEGRNREIRRLFLAAGFKVRRLVRVAIGALRLAPLEPGQGRELSEEEVECLIAELAAQQRSGGATQVR
jgi:23S rRNA pseudouridine2605 synthase